jgi:hypothetical protein
MKEPGKPLTLHDYAWRIGLILLSIGGCLCILYSTRWGAALSDDSYFYIHAARDLLEGKGFTLSPHFPPMLPLLLTTSGLSGLDPLTSIRWINAVLSGLNIFLTGCMIFKLSHSKVFSFTGALLFLASNTLIEAHSWAMSEPLYISFSLLGLLVLSRAVRDQRLSTFLSSGLLFGLAAATRYIGVSLLAAGVFVLFTWKPPTGTFTFHQGKRLPRMLGFFLAGLAPLFLWILRNQLMTGRATTRVFGWHPLDSNQWIVGLNTILLWAAPGRLVHGKELTWLGVMAALLGTWLLWRIARERGFIHRQAQALLQSPLVSFLILYLVTYTTTLVLARTFFDSRIPLDGRLLSPVLSASLILLMVLLGKLWKERGVLLRSALLIGCLYLLFVNGTRSIDMVQSYHELGRGYASARDHISETYAYLRTRPEIPVYSNALAAVYFWTGRDTYPIPPSSGVDEMKADMEKTGAYLVIFDSIPVELYLVTKDELTSGLVEQIRRSEATIYRHP